MPIKVTHHSTDAADLLKKLRGFSVKAGWFENAKYDDNKPVAGIAAVQDGGATISHPGGTPYKFGKNGEVVFVEKGTPNPVGITRPHTIVIPPRPFMKPSVEDNKEELIGQLELISRRILSGEITEKQAAEMIGAIMAGNIKKAIAKVNTPPLKASTVRRKRSGYADTKTTGSLTKPLIGSGHLLETVDYQAELK
jgi:hypothetical protein|nr:MAG TPA: virion morphogenesis protein [Caudoviricetes sp.]